MNDQTWVVLVDEKDQAIGLCEKLRAHQLGLRHRAFSIFLLRERSAGTEMLLQQRQRDKYHCPLYWSNACCSHPYDREPIECAAHRRLNEELGVDVPLTYAGHFEYRAQLSGGLIEHELDHLFYGYFEGDDLPFNPKEVEQTEWWPLSKMNALPQPITPWMMQAWQHVAKKIGY